MKAFNAVLKILAALAVVAGILYVFATYGDKIVAWAKSLWERISCCNFMQTNTPADELVSSEEVTPEDASAETAEEPIKDEDFEN